jgi:hypothetical protein
MRIETGATSKEYTGCSNNRLPNRTDGCQTTSHLRNLNARLGLFTRTLFLILHRYFFNAVAVFILPIITDADRSSLF